MIRAFVFDFGRVISAPKPDLLFQDYERELGLPSWLVKWRILHLLDVVFCSGDERCAKPDPAAFEATLERLGVKPEQTVFIDDTIEHVRAARVLGVHGILFRCVDRLVADVENLISGHVGGA